MADPDLVRIQRRALEAANGGDFDAMLAAFLPDAVWTSVDLGVTAEGRAAIRVFLGDWIGTFDDFALEIEEGVDLGSGITLAVVLQSGRLTGSDARVQWRFGAVGTWMDGMVAVVTTYSDLDEARAVAKRLAASGG